tara:strand:+ start:9187 stop:9459 length:273 start_codon:yes stop_codon:yes gene_type:complete
MKKIEIAKIILDALMYVCIVAIFILISEAKNEKKEEAPTVYSYAIVHQETGEIIYAEEVIEDLEHDRYIVEGKGSFGMCYTYLIPISKSY